MKTLNIIIATIFTLTVSSVNAQNGIYIAKDANVFFAADSATAVSNIQNNGNVTIADKAVVNFEGQQWSNGTAAQINGNGAVRFNGTTAQQVDASYNAAIGQGASFGTLQIDNKKGVELTGSNAKVRNELQFKAGVVVVNDNILVVAGKITGADSTKYVVTNNKDGYLLRENLSAKSGLVAFPVGTANGYTPAALNVKSGTDNYYVNVVNGVTVDADRSVNRTWNIGKQNNPNQDSVEVFLTHLQKEESAFFTSHEARSYVAQFVGNSWDTAFRKVMSVNNTNNRLFNGTIGSVSSFTVLAAKTGVNTHKPVVPTPVVTPEYKLNVWPNPTTDKFYVGINGNVNVKSIAIWNIVGIQMTSKSVNNQNTVEFSGFVPGTYVIGFIGANGKIIETRKVIVGGY